MKKFRYIFIFVVGLFFFSIFLASSVRYIYFSKDEGLSRFGFLAKPIKLMAETPSIMKTILLDPGKFFVRNNDASDGFTYFERSNSDSYPKLLVSYKDEKFGQKFELLDINTGNVLKQWQPDNKKLFEYGYNINNPRRPAKGSDLYFLHPFMAKDSSLLLTTHLTSLLAKIDKNNEILWTKNDKSYHHSLELGNDGLIYTCSRPFQSGQYDFLPGTYEGYRNNLMDDHITSVNLNTGLEIFDKSVIEILIENGYESLLVDKGQVISDPIHLNDVQPALNDTEFWQEGDLVISCRNINTVFLYRPESNKILWLQTGPWSNQHDVDFYDGNKIVVFGNDVIREESVIDPRITGENLSFGNRQTHNDIYMYNFNTDSITKPYHKLMKSENVGTITSGRCDILANGEIFIEETAQGRIIIGDSTTKKIEYVKRLDQDHISSLFWSRIIN